MIKNKMKKDTRIISIAAITLFTIIWTLYYLPIGSTTTIILLCLLFVCWFLLVIKILDLLLNHASKKIEQTGKLQIVIVTYVVSTLLLMFLFSQSYLFLQSQKLGYITYWDCTNTYSIENFDTDTQITDDYFYFSAITYLTIWYGEICPMWLSKNISVINGITWFVFNIIIIWVIMQVFTSAREQKIWKKKKS